MTISGHDHDHGHEDEHHHHHHDDAIKAFVFQSRKPFDRAKLEEYMGALTQVYGPDMLRYKGVLFMDGTNRRMIFQGVHMLMGADVGRPWGSNEKPSSKMFSSVATCRRKRSSKDSKRAWRAEVCSHEPVQRTMWHEVEADGCSKEGTGQESRQSPRRRSRRRRNRSRRKSLSRSRLGRRLRPRSSRPRSRPSQRR